ncbi:MAG: NFACT family protein [Clostridia bacterium]|nr:NFACT family protein [Clostridia bacterium]
MPFDGVVVKSVANELGDLLVGGRVEKIFQPEKDEILIHIRAKGENLKLLLSASATHPRIHITDVTKENPLNPPVFCMLLRKHLTGGRVTNIGFHDFERVLSLHIESINELGDLTEKKLIIEIMGRHSNIILVNDENKILDSIKHVDNEVSSIREVMPARPYIMPPGQEKTSILDLDLDSFLNEAGNISDISIEKHLLNSLKGFSPLLCREICFRAGVEGKYSFSNLPADARDRIKNELAILKDSIGRSNFSPLIIYNDKELESPLDFHCLHIKQNPFIRVLPTMSKVLDMFYSTKDNFERLKQKKSDLLKVLQNNLDRLNKKLALQQDKLREIADRENLKLFGELITANIYCISKGAKQATVQNYYSEDLENIVISLDENLSPQENAQKYFRQYTKAKSAFTNTTKQLEETNRELVYLESVLHLLENCVLVQEIEEIRQELVEQGYLTLKRKNSFKKQNKVSEPFHYRSSDGLDIFVGKNNRQNDLLTLKSSSSNDTWLHTRNIPGSHVIIKKLQHTIPERTLLEAAILAAYHSKAKMSSTVPVDYTLVKNVKKPPGSKPGMVTYDHFKTLIVTPDEALVNRLKVTK